MKAKKHSLVFCLDVNIVEPSKKFIEGRVHLEKRCEDFPFLPSTGMGIILPPFNDEKKIKLYVKGPGWLVESEKGFSWVIELKTSTTGHHWDNPSVSSEMVEEALKNGWVST